VNKFKTLKSDKQIVGHIDMSIHSIEMSFESTPLFHLNRIDELEFKKPVEEVIHVHEVWILDDYPQFSKKVIRDCLASRAHYAEQIESYCVDKDHNDELLLQKDYENEFYKFWKRQVLKSKRFLQIKLIK